MEALEKKLNQLENELAQTQTNLEKAIHDLEEKEKDLQHVSDEWDRVHSLLHDFYAFDNCACQLIILHFFLDVYRVQKRRPCAPICGVHAKLQQVVVLDGEKSP